MREYLSASVLQDLAGEWCLDPRWQSVIELARLNSFNPEMRAAMIRPDNSMKLHSVRNKTVAEIKIVGVMAKGLSFFADTSTVKVREEIASAVRDPAVHGILLSIDSPGGTVNGTAELGDAIKDANRKKPVYSWVGGLVASAAYWAASQSAMIFAGNRMSQAGSIGTYTSAFDLSKAFESMGVKAHLWSTGPLKAIGVPGVPITDEQSAHIQSRVNGAQLHFDAAVRSGRGMDSAQLEAVRSGEAFWAQEAINRRLIDGIKSHEQTLAAVAAA